MGVMRLGALLRTLDVLEGRYQAHRPVRGIRYDSRRVQPGDVFVAIRGRRTDGHHYIEEAQRRGAVAIVAEWPPPPGGVDYVRVPNARVALAQLSAAWFGHPDRKLKLVGITGSVGKTSTMIILRQLLQRAGLRVGICGSVVERPDGSLAHAPLTTPESWELQRRLRELVDAGVQVAVLEATSHALAQDRLHGIRFNAGIFLNLLPEHLDFHGTFAKYVAIKRRFLEHLKPGAPLIYNREDPRVAEIAERIPAHRRVAFGMESEAADVSVHGLQLDPSGSRFTLTFRRVGTSYPCRMALLGRHHIENALAAAAGAWALGLDPQRILPALETVKPFYRRTQPLRLNDLNVIDDTVGLPGSIHRCFEAVRLIAGREVVIVYAIRGSRGASVAAENAAALAKEVGRLRSAGHETWLLVTRSDDVVDAFNRVQPEEEAAVRKALADAGVAVRYHRDLATALEEALSLAKPEALILLLGAQGMNRGAELLRKLLKQDTLPRGTDRALSSLRTDTRL